MRCISARQLPEEDTACPVEPNPPRATLVVVLERLDADVGANDVCAEDDVRQVEPREPQLE